MENYTTILHWKNRLFSKKKKNSVEICFHLWKKIKTAKIIWALKTISSLMVRLHHDDFCFIFFFFTQLCFIIINWQSVTCYLNWYILCPTYPDTFFFVNVHVQIASEEEGEGQSFVVILYSVRPGPDKISRICLENTQSINNTNE